MTKKLWNPLFIGLLIITLACNKENDTEPEQTVLLSKVTWNNANQSGEVVYEYDNQNRIITMTEENNETISVNNISYNSSGNVSERVRSENGIENLKIIYTFTNNLITTVIQTKNEGQWVDGPKTEYTLNALGKIIKLQSFYKVEGEYVSDSYQLQIWDGGNIVNQETWDINDNKLFSITIDLDNKNNPYANFEILSGLNGYFKNNMKKQTTYHIANDVFSSYTYSYEYNDYNYPSKRWLSKTNDEDTTDPIVYFYEYIIM